MLAHSKHPETYIAKPAVRFLFAGCCSRMSQVDAVAVLGRKNLVHRRDAMPEAASEDERQEMLGAEVQL